MMKNRERYLVWRIVFIHPDGTKAKKRTCWRTDDIERVRKLAQGIRPEDKIQLYYTEFY